tara:strand:+ start:348 stop:482 length:135 start_codon:yes stop_codon:yes gene_type:complete
MQSKIKRRRGMPTTYMTIATEATAVQMRCSPVERRGKEEWKRGG